MELQQIKPRRALRFRSKQEIIHLLEKFESVKKQTSLTKFCKDHDVPTGTFCTWQRCCRQGKYAIHGKFIALYVEPGSSHYSCSATTCLRQYKFRESDDPAAPVCCNSMLQHTTFNLCWISRKTYDTS